MDRLNLNVLSINAYGIDIPTGDDTIFSGAIERQKDYAGFLNKYIIITPTIANGDGGEVKVGDNLSIYPIPVIGRFEFMRKTLLLAGELIKKEKIDCVICDNPFISAYLGVQLKKRYSVTLIVHSMAEMIGNPHYLKERVSNHFKNWLAKRNLRDTDVLRVSTKAELEHMVEKGINSKILHYVPFYIDFKEFESKTRDENFRAELLGDEFKNIILFVGRMAKQKDVPTLISTAEIVIKKHPDTLFAMIGSGPELMRIKNIVSHKGLEKNVKLLGKVPYSDVVKYYLASDIFAISSIYEGTCMVLHEAGICSLPVVATRFAGALDYIEEGVNGFLADIKDFGVMAEKINYIIENPDKKQSMGDNAKHIVKEKFGREEALRLYREMFGKIDKF